MAKVSRDKRRHFRKRAAASAPVGEWLGKDKKGQRAGQGAQGEARSRAAGCKEAALAWRASLLGSSPRVAREDGGDEDSIARVDMAQKHGQRAAVLAALLPV